MSRDHLQRYEQAFAERFGAVRAFGFWKGRVALYAILKGMGIKKGDEVIMPGYTCVMAVNPIMYLGARPVYVDVDPATFNLDPNQIEAKITPCTRLIIAQHTYGYPADMSAITDICQRHAVPLIEDCCLALGSKYRGRDVGTFGLASYFSFQWNKPYTSGLGGMAVVHDPGLADRIEAVSEAEAVAPSARETSMLRAQLAVYRTFIYPKSTALAQNVFRLLVKSGLLLGSSSNAEFQPIMEPDFFKRMSPMQARVGLRQLRRLDGIIAHRRMMTRLYDELFRQRDWPIPTIPADIDPVLVRYPVRVADKEQALATAARHFVEIGSWFEVPLHPKETPMQAFGYHAGMCPEAERACAETINLPVHPRAGRATTRRAVDFVMGIGPAPAPEATG